jgi:hypothetical protein
MKLRKTMARKISLIVAAFTLAFGGIAAAHHSGAAYDMEHPRTMEGTVRTVNWTNPHITFVIESDAKDGQPAINWVFEASSPGVLTRWGWTKRSVQPGDHGVFVYAPLRDGNPGGLLLKATLPGGKEFSYTLSPPDQPDQ